MSPRSHSGPRLGAGHFRRMDAVHHWILNQLYDIGHSAMKYFLWILAASFSSALVFGVWVTSIEEKPMVRPGQEVAYQQVRQLLEEQQQTLESAGSAVPRAQCDEPFYDFGDMAPYTEASHEFLIRNTGNADLILRRGETTCTCTVADIGVVKVAPGESYPVKLTWRTGGSGRTFHQRATIHTNDPANPSIALELRGQVRVLVAPNIERILLEDIAPDSSTTINFLVGSEVWETFQIVRVDSTDAAVSISARLLDVAELRHGLRSAAEVEVRVQPQGQQGQGRLRLFVRPPQQWMDEYRQDQLRHSGGLSLQADDTILIEVPWSYRTLRRLSLYGEPVESYPPHLALGRVRMSDTSSKQWVLYARIRGTHVAEQVECTVQGIVGLTAEVSLKEGLERAGQTAVIRLKFTDEVHPAIYDRFHAGLLRLVARGEGLHETLELPIRLTVLADDA
ncbi:MAG: hypothetical protein KatS3mg111_1154 [Pirellulaceae bacterium]|nr:MAG: hypothetical protein KatS3mg111_1154 [Pirellulaceae bacterium]